MIKALIFDLGGTLVRANKFYEEECNCVLAYLLHLHGNPINAYGYHVTPEQILMATRMVWGYARLKQGFDSGEYGRRRFVNDLTRSVGYNISDERAKKVHHILHHYMLNATEIIPNVLEDLKKLKSMGLILALVSDISDAYCRQLLVKHGLVNPELVNPELPGHGLDQPGVSGYFDLILTSEHVGAPKSTLKPFKLALEKLYVKPEQVVVVGNDSDFDIVPAKKIGAFAIKVDSGWQAKPKETQYEPDVRVSEFSEVLPVIESLS